MPLPYQYRDYPLAVFMGLAAVVFGLIGLFGNDHQEVSITLEGTCCLASICPVVESLTAISSAKDFSHRADGPRTIVSLRTSRSTSPETIWNAVAATQCRPLELRIDQREYVGKSQN